MIKTKILLCIVWCIGYASYVVTFPQESLVVSSPEPPKESTVVSTTEAVPSVPQIYDLRIQTNVSNRFAHTRVTSKVKNLADSPQEATFSVVLPDKAFITGFIMEIDGKSYEAYIKEKEEAKKDYDQAVASGQAAAHVAVSARDSNRFTVNVNVQPESKATFHLSYEELLERQNEQYEVVLNIHAGQLVKEMNVEVHINESRPLKFVRVPVLRTGNELSKNDEKLDPHATINKINETAADVLFSPDIDRQKELGVGLGGEEKNGISGQFVVQYDVERDPYGGEVLVDEGYFVHFFAPSELEPLPKHVVFVLDTSGSMEGVRIRQLKEAMTSILNQLKKEDMISIVEFASSVKVWDIEEVLATYEEGGDPWAYNYETTTASPEPKSIPKPVQAHPGNINKSIQVVEKLNANGGTDIQSALKVGIRIVKEFKSSSNNSHQPLLIFLTDGEPTVGEHNTEKITNTITELNEGNVPVFSLSFGDGADREFLQKISLRNLGFSRHIYEGADANIQLEEFYKQISSPLLSDIKFKYVSEIKNLTKTDFPIFFWGSEIVVAGIAEEGFKPAIVEGKGFRGPIKFTPKLDKPVTSIERLWAYLTLKQILEQRDAAEDKSGPTQEALRLALKYKFVSDVTSLVVVKPNSTNAVNTEDASKTHPNYPGVQMPNFKLAASVPLSSGGVQYAAAVGLPVFKHGGGVGGGYRGYVHSALALRPPSYPYFTTTFRPRSPTKDLDQLKKELPWLSDILIDNNTIALSKGNYSLGIGETIPAHPVCSVSTSSVCETLFDCPQLYTKLVDVETYEKSYFCSLEQIAGVCCPQ